MTKIFIPTKELYMNAGPVLRRVKMENKPLLHQQAVLIPVSSAV